MVTSLLDRIITENVTISEEDDVILNCTMEHFDGRHVWSREDRTPALTTTRVLTEDTQLEIKQASIADAGVFVCKNGQFITHRFIVRVKGRSINVLGDVVCLFAYFLFVNLFSFFLFFFFFFFFFLGGGVGVGHIRIRQLSHYQSPLFNDGGT